MTDELPARILTIDDLIQEYGKPLQRFAVSLTRDTDQADDLVQETFIQALISLSLLSGLNPYQRRAWLFQVLKNRFLDGQRARKRWQALCDHLAEQMLIDGQAAPQIVQYGLLEMVPETYRDVLKKRFVLGMTSAEIGRELHIPAATVRSRLRLAIKWLRAHQSDYI